MHGRIYYEYSCIRQNSSAGHIGYCGHELLQGIKATSILLQGSAEMLFFLAHGANLVFSPRGNLLDGCSELSGAQSITDVRAHPSSFLISCFES